MKGIKVIGPLFLAGDGYGSMCREFVLALIDAGVNVTVQSILFKREPDYGELGDEYDKIFPYVDKKIDYDVIVQCLTPNHFPLFYEHGKNIFCNHLCHLGPRLY